MSGMKVARASHVNFSSPCHQSSLCPLSMEKQRLSRTARGQEFLCQANGRSEPVHGIQSTRRTTLGLLTSLAVAKGLTWPSQACSDQGKSLLEKEVAEFTLSNGLHFIVLGRHYAPIVSCHTHANVGAFNEVDGKTGLAHMLEHEAFKGSDRIGTTNWLKEKPLLDAQDEVFYDWRQARSAGDSKMILKHAEKLLKLQKDADAYAVANDYGARFTQAGAVGLNASTSHDATKYHVSLPSNRLELWFALEAERFQASVFRELYSEKRVVLEERRARVDNSPVGKYLEEFNALKFGNNYRRPVIGYQSEIEDFGRHEVLDFFQRHYVPSKLTVAVVGDTNVDEVFKLAEKYFGGWTPSFKPLQSTDKLADLPVKPDSGEQRRFEKASSAGPILLKGYYRGDINSDDAFMMEVVDDVMTGGRTARFDRNLIQTGKLVSASFNSASPGSKYPCSSAIFAVPSKGVSLPEAENLVVQELERVADGGIEDWELRRIKKATKVDTLEAIRINTSMAASLAATHALTGTWKTILSDLQRVEDLRSAEVRDAAARIFTEGNSFTGYMTPKILDLKEQIGLKKM